MLIQCTTEGNLSSRVKKARANPEVKAWVSAGAAFECWGWAKRDGRWTVRRVAISPDMMSAELPPRTRRKRKPAERSLFDDC
jgi:hypothetical protein